MLNTRCFINQTDKELQRLWNEEHLYQSARIADVLPFEGGLRGRVEKIVSLDTGDRWLHCELIGSYKPSKKETPNGIELVLASTENDLVGWAKSYEDGIGILAHARDLGLIQGESGTPMGKHILTVRHHFVESVEIELRRLDALGFKPFGN